MRWAAAISGRFAALAAAPWNAPCNRRSLQSLELAISAGPKHPIAAAIADHLNWT